MNRKYLIRGLVIFLAVISMPLFLCLTVWQSTRYQNLKKELTRLEQAQGEWVESNKRLIAEIVMLSSQKRIEDIAVNSLSLHKIRPENVLQVTITEGKGRGY